MRTFYSEHDGNQRVWFCATFRTAKRASKAFAVMIAAKIPIEWNNLETVLSDGTRKTCFSVCIHETRIQTSWQWGFNFRHDFIIFNLGLIQWVSVLVRLIFRNLISNRYFSLYSFQTHIKFTSLSLLVGVENSSHMWIKIQQESKLNSSSVDWTPWMHTLWIWLRFVLY